MNVKCRKTNTESDLAKTSVELQNSGLVSCFLRNRQGNGACMLLQPQQSLFVCVNKLISYDVSSDVSYAVIGLMIRASVLQSRGCRLDFQSIHIRVIS